VAELGRRARNGGTNGVDPATWPASGDGEGGDRAGVVRRRASLPGGRAVIGGFLVGLALVVTFAAYRGTSRRPQQTYVVAARRLAPGERLTAADLATTRLDLGDPAVRRQVFDSPATLIGAAVIAPIEPGALIEAGSVVGRGGAPGTEEVSFSIDRSRAVGGTLRPGEYVDVLGTFGAGADSYTAVLVAHVRLLAVSAQGGPLGGTTVELIVVEVLDGADGEAIADAAVASQLTLVRSAELAPGATPVSVTPYRPPAAPAGGAASAATGAGPGPAASTNPAATTGPTKAPATAAVPGTPTGPAPAVAGARAGPSPSGP